MAEGEKSSERVANVKEELCSNQFGVTRTFRDLRPSHCLLKIDSYSLFATEKYESGVFEAGGYKWRLIFYPDGDIKRNGKGFISLYLAMAETDGLPLGWDVNVIFKLFVLDQTRHKYLVQDGEGAVSLFYDVKTVHGLPQFLPLDYFKNASNGYLIGDSCVLGAEVFVLKCTCKLESLSFVKPFATRVIGSTFTWKISNFMTLDKEKYYSEAFIISGTAWKLLVYPKHEGKAIALYLVSVDAQAEKEVHANFKLCLRDQVYRKHHEKTLSNTFTTKKPDWGLRNSSSSMNFMTLQMALNGRMQ